MNSVQICTHLGLIACCFIPNEIVLDLFKSFVKSFLSSVNETRQRCWLNQSGLLCIQCVYYDCVWNNYFQIPFSRFCGHNSHSSIFIFCGGHAPKTSNNVHSVFTKCCQQKLQRFMPNLVTLFDILVYFYILTFLGFFLQMHFNCNQKM